MEYRRLGKSGLKISSVSLGSWLTFGGQITEDVAEANMKLAYDKGINFFDNAEGYAEGESEVVMGKLLKRFSWPRETFLVSSKVFWGQLGPNNVGLNRKHVFEACHAALRRLQVDYLDLYFCHRPDPDTPIEETVAAMHQLIIAGKVLYWGTSEWSAQQIMEAHAIAREHHMTPPTMEQPLYNMLFRERFENEYARLCSEIGLGATIFSPLASGLLTGKYSNAVPSGSRLDKVDWLRKDIMTNERLAAAARVGAIARDLGIPMAVFAVAWCLKNPNVSTAILGATKIDQLRETLTAVDVVDKLTSETMDRVDEALQPTKVLV